MIWVDNSKILAIYAVVFLHVSAGVVIGNDVGTEYWWFGNVYDSAVRWCVPVFVMISGALLLDPNKQESLQTFYTKRISRILIPIVFWSIFYLAWAFLKGAVKGDEIAIIDFLKKILSGKPYYHLWFLYMILSLYLFTPFLRKIVANSSKKEIFYFITIAFAMSAFNYAYEKFSSGGSKLFINWFFSYIPYFILGFFVRQDNRDLSGIFLWGIFLISFISTFVGCYILAINSGLESGLYFYGYLSVTVIPMSISLMYILKSCNKPIYNTSFTKKVSTLTLGIYLIHPLILDIVNYKQYGTMIFHPMVSVPVIAFAVFAASTVIAYIVFKTPYIRRTI